MGRACQLEVTDDLAHSPPPPWAAWRPRAAGPAPDLRSPGTRRAGVWGPRAASFSVPAGAFLPPLHPSPPLSPWTWSSESPHLLPCFPCLFFPFVPEGSWSLNSRRAGVLPQSRRRWAQTLFWEGGTPPAGCVLGGDTAFQQVPSWFLRSGLGDTSHVGSFILWWSLDPGHRG